MYIYKSIHGNITKMLNFGEGLLMLHACKNICINCYIYSLREELLDVIVLQEELKNINIVIHLNLKL